MAADGSLAAISSPLLTNIASEPPFSKCDWSFSRIWTTGIAHYVCRCQPIQSGLCGGDLLIRDAGLEGVGIRDDVSVELILKDGRWRASGLVVRWT